MSFSSWTAKVLASFKPYETLAKAALDYFLRALFFLIFLVPVVWALTAAVAAALYFLAYGFNLSKAFEFFNGFFF
jgi:hypothetical protein